LEDFVMENTAAADDIRQVEIHCNHISLAQPWQWIEKGWRDMIAARQYSLTYGAVVVLISGLITLGLVSEDLGFMVPFLAAGFYLLAPVIGLGLYQMSAHLERNEPLRFCHFLEAWKGKIRASSASLPRGC
jgi:uncharacterized membrane protein